MQTLDDLERLTDIDSALDDEAKAEAKYQWQAISTKGICCSTTQRVARDASRDAQLAQRTNFRSAMSARIWRYVQEHDAAARALTCTWKSFVSIRRPSRADSLYQRSLPRRLSGYNGYWRARYEEDFARHARSDLADLRREIRSIAFARRRKWKPSTRTVSGEPAWPLRRHPEVDSNGMGSSKIRIGERQAAESWELFGEVTGAGSALAAGCFVGRSPARDCQQLSYCVSLALARGLFELFARVYARQASRSEVIPAQVSSYGSLESYTVGARARVTSHKVWHGFSEVILDDKGRAALALNLMTHGLLTALLYVLVWAVRLS